MGHHSLRSTVDRANPQRACRNCVDTNFDLQDLPRYLYRQSSVATASASPHWLLSLSRYDTADGAHRSDSGSPILHGVSGASSNSKNYRCSQALQSAYKETTKEKRRPLLTPMISELDIAG